MFSMIAGGHLGFMVFLAVLGPPALSHSEAPETPMAIPVGEGSWVVSEGRPGRPRIGRKATLSYQVPTFPRITLNHIQLECEFPGDHRIKVIGLIPAQRFPQPEMAIAIGDWRWTAIPNARYNPRSQPVAHSVPAGLPLDDNLRGRDLSWPGHPAFADLTLFRQADPALLEALRSGQPIRVSFDGQDRSYPAIPAEVAARYAERCAEATPRPVASR